MKVLVLRDVFVAFLSFGRERCDFTACVAWSPRSSQRYLSLGLNCPLHANIGHGGWPKGSMPKRTDRQDIDPAGKTFSLFLYFHISIYPLHRTKKPLNRNYSMPRCLYQFQMHLSFTFRR